MNTLSLRFFYKRRPTFELAIVAVIALTGLITATFIITNGFLSSPQAATSPSGQWVQQTSTTNVGLNNVLFVDSLTGWAIGEQGTILHTVNGGLTWVTQDSSTDVELVSLDFTDADVGMAVGKLGVILHTSNGGVTWELVDLYTTLGLDLVGVSMIDKMKAWVITERGNVIFATSDGGINWSRKTIGTTEVRADISFVDSEYGWIMLSNGTALHTSDGGMNWERQDSSDGRILGAFFLDENHGWTAGWRGKGRGLEFNQFMSDGVIARTQNGGKTWFQHDSGTGQFLWDVAFVNRQEGWAVGASGTILHSSDGGVTWKPQLVESNSNLKAVHFADDQNGWAVGENGTILKYVR